MDELTPEEKPKESSGRGWVPWVVCFSLLLVTAVLGGLFYVMVPSNLHDMPAFADQDLAALIHRNVSTAPGSSNRPYLGITYQELGAPASEETTTTTGGATITSVAPGSPAAMAGLNTGDLILALDGQAVSRENPFLKLLGSRKPGDRVKLAIQRGQDHLSMYVSLGKR